MYRDLIKLQCFEGISCLGLVREDDLAVDAVANQFYIMQGIEPTDKERPTVSAHVKGLSDIAPFELIPGSAKHKTTKPLDAFEI